MNVSELKDDPEMREYIRSICKHKLFLQLKDAFVAHTPAGEREAVASQSEDPIVLAHGKNLGTRFVFNELEKVSNQAKQPDKKKPKTTSEPDPDLAT